MTRKRAAQSPEYAVSDEAAAYIADALMEIALQFEASHFAQIRRHYQSTPEHVPHSANVKPSWTGESAERVQSGFISKKRLP
jgi:hypothetical protein